MQLRGGFHDDENCNHNHRPKTARFVQEHECCDDLKEVKIHGSHNFSSRVPSCSLPHRRGIDSVASPCDRHSLSYPSSSLMHATFLGNALSSACLGRSRGLFRDEGRSTNRRYDFPADKLASSARRAET